MPCSCVSCSTDLFYGILPSSVSLLPTCLELSSLTYASSCFYLETHLSFSDAQPSFLPSIFSSCNLSFFSLVFLSSYFLPGRPANQEEHEPAFMNPVFSLSGSALRARWHSPLSWHTGSKFPHPYGDTTEVHGAKGQKNSGENVESTAL